MKIRKAEEKDVCNLCELLRIVQALHVSGRPDIFKAGTNKYSQQDVKNIISNPLTPVFVAVDQTDNAIGYAFCSIIEQNETANLLPLKTFYIDDLCVSESLRGRGIGTKLFDYVCAYAKSEGCYHLTLNVWHLNQSAVRFYEKLKMKPLKTIMEKIL